ncbi:hypothetical protein [Azospirillum griseum]|uniref:Lipoprotein n=1 Tax=Azospirillum griseum TaxID=2496639 RepID=A0A3S0IBQ9_9PROT|nr:hypothetical protein [Azospirillum griseum]RTR15024.1 hypothetical protein EJ903_23405 [Azospirillum griseum]
MLHLRLSPTWTLLSVAALALSGCATAPDAAKTGTASPLSDTDRYVQAVERSAVYEEANVRPLRPLTYPMAALTLTNNPSWAVGQEGKTVTLTNSYGTWVTVEPEVKEICKTYKAGEVIQKLHYLLGLQPAVPSDSNAKFVRISIAPQSVGPTGNGVFRPCPDPDPTKTACANTINGPQAFVSWFANQQVFSYRKGPDLKQTGYPWTRLGYTYNWDPQASDIRGAQEYIVPGGTKVTVVEIVSPQEYCAR